MVENHSKKSHFCQKVKHIWIFPPKILLDCWPFFVVKCIWDFFVNFQPLCCAITTNIRKLKCVDFTFYFRAPMSKMGLFQWFSNTVIILGRLSLSKTNLWRKRSHMGSKKKKLLSWRKIWRTSRENNAVALHVKIFLPTEKIVNNFTA